MPVQRIRDWKNGERDQLQPTDLRPEAGNSGFGRQHRYGPSRLQHDLQRHRADDAEAPLQ